MRNNTEFKELVKSKHKSLIKKHKQKNAFVISSSLFICALLCTFFLNSSAIKRVFNAESVYDTVFESEEQESEYAYDSSVQFFESAVIEQDSDYISEEKKPTPSSAPEFDECVSENFSENISINDSINSDILADSSKDNEIAEEEAGNEEGFESIQPMPEYDSISFFDLPYRISWSNSSIINRTNFEEER